METHLSMVGEMVRLRGGGGVSGCWLCPSYPGVPFWHRYELDQDKMERREQFARSLRRLREMKENHAARSLAAIAREMCR